MKVIGIQCKEAAVGEGPGIKHAGKALCMTADAVGTCTVPTCLRTWVLCCVVLCCVVLCCVVLCCVVLCCVVLCCVVLCCVDQSQQRREATEKNALGWGG